MPFNTPPQYATPDDTPLIIDVPDSSGGINTSQHETEIADNQLTVANNIDLSNTGKKKKRLGTNKVLDDLGDLPINALVYLQAPSVDARMVHIYGQRMYKSTDPLATSGSWVDIDSTNHFTSNQTSTVGLEAGSNLVFTNGTDNIFTYDGTSITDAGDSNTTPPKGKVLAYFKGKLWIANTTAAPDYVWYSSAYVGTFSALLTYDRLVNVFRVDSGTSSQITNMVAFEDSSLVIFKEDSVYELLVSGDTASYWNLRPIDTRHGCPGFDCAKYYQGKIYYLSRDGIRTLPVQADPVSTLISDEIDDINWAYINRARAIVFDDCYYLSVPTGDSAYPNKVYVMDLGSNSWTVITGWNVGCWGIFINSGEETLMYGDANDGVVWHCYKSTQFNDASTAINYQEETKAFDFGQPFSYKCGGEIEISIISSTGNTVTVSAAIDGGSYTELGTCTATKIFRLDALGPYKNIKFKMVNNATSTEQLIFNGFRVVTYPEKYQRNITG